MRILVCGLVFVVFVFPCWGATIIVDQNGSGDFTNIQDAIDYSWDGDTIVVQPGTYNQGIKFNGRAVTLTSTGPDNPSVVASTIITKTSGTAVTFDFGEGLNSVITGFTITGSPCVSCSSSAPTILKNVINCPTPTSNSYGITGCNGTISDNTVSSSYYSGMSKCNGNISHNTISAGYMGMYNCSGNILNNTVYSPKYGIYGCSGNISNNLIPYYTNYGIMNCTGIISNNRISDCNFGIFQCDGDISNNIITGALLLEVNNSYGINECTGDVHNNIVSNFRFGLHNKLDSTCAIIIRNNTFVGCRVVGIRVQDVGYCSTLALVKNNIIAHTNGTGSTNGGLYGECQNSYNCFWANTPSNYAGGAKAGVGDFYRNPLFAVDGYWSGNKWVDGDYHLKSTAGRYDPNTETWVLDDVNSPCIDKGDPGDSIGYEPNPNGGRINVGAYGGTWEASKSPNGSGPEPLPPVCSAPIPGDLNGDCKVDFEDFAIMASHWLECNLDPPSACW